MLWMLLTFALAGETPWTLEEAGFTVYVREGCPACHDYVGSRIAGPSLHRIGGTRTDAWHLKHLRDPTSTSPRSDMPSFARLAAERIRVELEPDSRKRVDEMSGALGIDGRVEILALIAFLQSR